MNNNPISYSDPEGDIAFVPILIGMGVGALIHTGIHLATNNFTFNNWNWGSFAGSVVAGGVGGAVGPALEAARIGGFYGPDIRKILTVPNAGLHILNLKFMTGGGYENTYTSSVVRPEDFLSWLFR